MARTREEKFLIKFYESALASGNVENELNCVEVGHSIGLHENGMKAIVKQLVMANFLKKIDYPIVKLTSNGCALVEDLLNK